MMADELLNAQDLTTAKKHDTFHSEVITGKTGGLSTGANIDYATNAVTGQVQKTLPAIIDGLDWSYVGKFADGVTFTKKTDFAIDDDGVQWIYTGTLPFTATAGTVPSEPIYQVVHVRSHAALGDLNPSDGSAHNADDIGRGLSTVDDDLTSIEFDVSALQASSSQLTTRTSNLEASSSQLTTRTSNLESTASSLDARVTTSEGDISVLQLGQGSSVYGYATLADLNADLVPEDGSIAYVTNDSTAKNNGTYRKSGATGTGSWVKSSSDLASQAYQRTFPPASPLDPHNATEPVSGKSVAYAKDFVNVTVESPLPAGQYYTFSSAVLTIAIARQKRGMILHYEVSDDVWETIEFRGDVVTEWIRETKWFTVNYTVINTRRATVNKKHWKPGLILNYDNAGTRVVEQFIGPNFPSNAAFMSDTNWIRLSTISDVLATNVTKDKIQSLQVALYEDSTRIDLVNGAINASNGQIANLTDTAKLITPRMLPVTELEEISVSAGHEFIITQLDVNGLPLAFTSWITSIKSFNVATVFVMLQIRFVGGGTITRSDIGIDDLTIVSKLKPAWRETYINDRFSNDALSNAFVVSDWAVQKMAHVSTVTGDNFSEGGFLWSGYYASEDTYNETISSNVDCKLLKMNPCDFSKPVEFNALSKGEIVGSFEQATSTAPYDPTLIIKASEIMYLMVADNVNDSEGLRYVNRSFDKTTDTFASAINNLFIRYTHDSTTYTKVLSVANVTTMFERLFNRTGINLGPYPIFSGRIIERGGFYWVYLGSLGFNPTGIQGCILRSVDGITWDYVSAPPLAWYGVWEGAVEVIGDYVYAFLKADNRYRIYRYNYVTDTWDAEVQIAGKKLSRPFLWYYNNKLYAIYNGPDNVTTWGTVNRSTVVISVIDQNTLEILDQQTIKTDAGSHYMSATEFKGTPYYMFTEDRRKHDINQMKGNVSIIKMDFLKI